MDQSELFHLTGSQAVEIDEVMTVDGVDLGKQRQALDCQVTYRETIGRAGVRRNIPREMVSDELGKQLHDRATRGETLTAQERASLETWYAAQDQAEIVTLNLTTPETVVVLQAQIDSVLEQLEAAARRIKELAQENDRLCGEIATLHRRLAQQATVRAA